MSNLKKNVILEGVFASEVPDTSGEVLSIDGADISDLQTGKAVLNTEHINPDDAGNKEVDKDFKGFQTIIGRVITAKKIRSADDCATDKEMAAWNKVQRPMIYGQAEIWDGEDAHDNARAAASIARMFSKNQDGPQLGLSVEGSTLKREGNYLKETVIRKMALTLKPCNRTAFIDITESAPPPRVSKSENIKTYMGGSELLRKSVSMQFVNVYVPQIFNDFGLSDAVTKLKKALTAGEPSAAPSALTGGAALQKESQLDKLVKLVGRKLPNRDAIKKAVPGISDNDVEVIEKALKQRHFMKNVQDFEQINKDLLGKK